MKRNLMTYKMFINSQRLFIFLFFISLPSFSQQPNLSFNHINVGDGLASPNVFCIYQDCFGFIWLGTDDGLVMYDGYKFKKYIRDINDSTSISTGYIRIIVGTNTGDLWIGTSFGLNFFDRQKECFTRFLTDPNHLNTINANDVNSIVFDQDSNLWIGTTEGGLNFLNVKKKTFKHFVKDPDNTNSISSNRILKLYIDKKQQLWIGTWEGMVDKYDRQTNTFLHFILKDKNTGFINQDQVREIIEDKKSQMWVATSGSGMFQILPLTDKTYEFINFRHEPLNEKSLSNNHISQIKENADGGLWIGTENGGLNYFDPETQTFEHYFHNELNPESLAHNSIWSLFQDKSKNLWIGTFTTGINLNVYYKSMFKTFKNLPGIENSLSFNTVSSFFEDHKGNIWIGTDGGGLNLFNRKEEKFTRFNTKNSELGSDAVLDIYEDSRKNLWIGTWEGGLNLMNRETGKIKRYTKQNSALGTNNIITITEDNNGKLWIGTFWGDGGISSMDLSTHEIKTYKTDNSGLPHNTTFTIVKGLHNDLYIGTADGFSIFNPGILSFKNFRNVSNNPNSLSNNTVIAILVAKDSSIWIGTTNGLNKFNLSTETFKRYHIKDGLPSAQIAGIEQDNNGYIWISSGKGLTRLDPKKEEFVNFDETDGLQGLSYFRCSSYKSSTGELYFGGTSGFNVFEPEKVKVSLVRPPLYLTGLRIFNTLVDLRSEDAPIQRSILTADKVRLLYNQSVVTFEFTALYYASTQKLKYEYKLEGFDKNWNTIRDERSATYTNLNPGKYVFRVRIPYNNGICNEEGIFIPVIVVPPFWMTWWFRTLMGLLFVVLLLAIYFLRIKSVQEQNKMLEKMVNERTTELQQKNELLWQQSNMLNETNTLLEERQQQIEEQTEVLFFQKEELEKFNKELKELNATKDKFFTIIAHDIKNPFNAIIGFSELMIKNYNVWTNEKKLKTLKIISGSAKGLYGLLENLLQWSGSQRGLIEFTPEKIQLNKEIKSIVKLLNDSATAKEIEIETELESKDIEIDADLRMLNTIFRNLVSNAIKFSYPGSAIKVSTKKIDGYAEVSISDKGIGISQDNLAKLFKLDIHHSTIGTNKESGTGLGLILVNEFVRKHNGIINVESKESIGTTFNIKFPLKH